MVPGWSRLGIAYSSMMESRVDTGIMPGWTNHGVLLSVPSEMAGLVVVV